MQLALDQKYASYYPPKTQLLKWVGNKQRFAGEIAKYFPVDFNTFYEPFLGSGAITATVAPSKGEVGVEAQGVSRSVAHDKS